MRLMILALSLLLISAAPQIEFEHNPSRVATPEFKFKNIPSPSKDDAASKAKLMMIDGVLDGGSGELSTVIDGLVPKSQDDPGGNMYFNAGTMGGRFLMDFEHVLDIKEVVTYSWHPSSRGPQLYKVYGATGAETDFKKAPLRGVDPATMGWTFIATVSTIPKQGEDGGQYAARLSDASGSLGKFRYLLFDCYVTELNDDFGNTFYSEIDVDAK